MTASTVSTVPAGAAFVVTPAYEEALVKAEEMAASAGVLLVTGPPGVGKTATCRQVMRDMAASHRLDGLWVQLGTKPNPKETVCQLLLALGIEPRRSEPTWVLSLELGELLATKRRTVWIDEAHHLRTDAFTTIRTIHDRPDADWMLGLVGTDVLLKRLRADQPELLSRVGRRVSVTRIDDDRILLDTLTAWHPLLAGCNPDRLLRMNRVGPKGNFRAWTHLLETLVRLTTTAGSFTEQVEAVALHQCGYTLPSVLARWLPR